MNAIAKPISGRPTPVMPKPSFPGKSPVIGKIGIGAPIKTPPSTRPIMPSPKPSFPGKVILPGVKTPTPSQKTQKPQPKYGLPSIVSKAKYQPYQKKTTTF